MSTKSPVAHGSPPPDFVADERHELEAVAEALGNSSRLLRLITYIGEKYFQGETDKLHEYEIATEVFGRSRATFNPGEDAIVRVEAHRLRKRLKEYYEGDGKDHPVQVLIPPGSYVPVFQRRRVDAEKTESESAAPRRKIPSWVYAAAAAGVFLVVITAYFAFQQYSARKNSTAEAASAVPSPAHPLALAYAKVPLRILAGDSGKPQTDSAGAVWLPDVYFQFGGSWNRPEGFIGRTSDPMLFEHWRNGDFSYGIPLRPGTYELHLYFLSAEPDASSPPTFSVSVNDKPLLTGFDINSDAMGPNIADERVFRDVSPAADGILHLGFASERSPAVLNAIEILPGLPQKLLPVRIVTQPASFTDSEGHFWRPDDYYLGGYTSAKRLTVAGTPNPDLYAGERYGYFSYSIPVDPRDQYTLVLHFAELYFGPNVSGVGGVGSRVFRVSCNGNTLLDNFDIYREVGSLHALTKTFFHLRPTALGKLNITFEPIVNNATVSGIEVLDESQ